MKATIRISAPQASSGQGFMHFSKIADFPNGEVARCTLHEIREQCMKVSHRSSIDYRWNRLSLWDCSDFFLTLNLLSVGRCITVLPTR